MNERTEVDGQRAGVAVLNQIRTIGPYVEHLARPVGQLGLPEVFVARRPHPDRTDGDGLSRRLEAGAGRAQVVEHHLTLQYFGILEANLGEVVQLLEWFPAADVDHLLKVGAEQLEPMDARPAVWMARQAFDALAHAHALGVVHGALGPNQILVDPSGAVKVDFGLSTRPAEGGLTTDYVDVRYARSRSGRGGSAAFAPGHDVYALAAILFELLTGESVVDLETAGSVRAFRPELPPNLDQLLADVLGTASNIDARTMESELGHAFYVDLEGDDFRDGQQRLARWIETTRTGPVTAIDSEGPTDVPDASTVTVQGQFTKALHARAQPVEPQDFSRDDQLSTPNGDWSPAVLELSTVATPVVANAQPSSEQKTEKTVFDSIPYGIEAPDERGLSMPESTSFGPSPLSMGWVIFAYALMGFMLTFAFVLLAGVAL